MMFDAPEYASYVDLMRELRLEHVFGQAEWAFIEDPEARDGGVITTRLIHEGEQAPNDGVWLPLLHQWLAMLERAGVWAVILERKNGVAFCTDATIGSGHPAAQAPTREEAAARLWKAVVDEIAQREGVTSY